MSTYEDFDDEDMSEDEREEFFNSLNDSDDEDGDEEPGYSCPCCGEDNALTNWDGDHFHCPNPECGVQL